jgi:putative CocE/NonD family hydrolase
VRLFTAVYVPKDRSRSHPILLTRTPYGIAPYGVDAYPRSIGPSEELTSEGFIVAYQDVRGRSLSEGEFVEMRPHRPSKGPQDVDESTDTFDTVEWLVKNVPGNSGRVGQWGISYDGFYAAAALAGAHPALKAVSPQAPVADLYMGDDAYHNGAFLLAHNFGFYTFFAERKGPPGRPRPGQPFDYGTPDGYEYYLRMGPLANSLERLPDNRYWKANLDHTTYDEFWRSRSIVPHLKQVTPAVMTVGGWFDAEDLQGPLAVYRQIERSSPGAVNHLVMGPWSHGAWARGDGDRLGNVHFATKTAVFYRERVERPFFLEHLLGRSEAKLPEAYAFHTGVNEWRRHDAWPPRAAALRRLHLAASGRLAWEAPSAGEDAFDEYPSDPARPVPHLGYVVQGTAGDYMTEDQRFASRRPDVLVYETEPLAADLGAAGPVEVTLHVSTTGTDSDFVVKLIDVYPPDFPQPPGSSGPPAHWVRMGGYQQLVRGEPFRGKFRRGFDSPVPFEPGKPDAITFTMPDVAHTFRRGHRVMVQVQSSWFPHVDRNPQTFVDIPHARPEDFRKATQRVYRSSSRPSSVGLWVLEGREAVDADR